MSDVDDVHGDNDGKKKNRESNSDDNSDDDEVEDDNDDDDDDDDDDSEMEVEGSSPPDNEALHLSVLRDLLESENYRTSEEEGLVMICKFDEKNEE